MNGNEQYTQPLGPFTVSEDGSEISFKRGEITYRYPVKTESLDAGEEYSLENIEDLDLRLVEIVENGSAMMTDLYVPTPGRYKIIYDPITEGVYNFDDLIGYNRSELLPMPREYDIMTDNEGRLLRSKDSETGWVLHTNDPEITDGSWTRRQVQYMNLVLVLTNQGMRERGDLRAVNNDEDTTALLDYYPSVESALMYMDVRIDNSQGLFENAELYDWDMVKPYIIHAEPKPKKKKENRPKHPSPKPISPRRSPKGLGNTAEDQFLKRKYPKAYAGLKFGKAIDAVVGERSKRKQRMKREVEYLNRKEPIIETTEWQDICRTITDNTNLDELRKITEVAGLPTMKDGRLLGKAVLCAQLAKQMSEMIYQKNCFNLTNVTGDDISQIPRECLLKEHDGNHCFDVMEVVDQEMKNNIYTGNALSKDLIKKAKKKYKKCQEARTGGIHTINTRAAKQQNTQKQTLRTTLVNLQDFKYADAFLKMSNKDIEKLIKKINEINIISTRFRVNPSNEPNLNMAALISDLRNHFEDGHVAFSLNEAYEAMGMSETRESTRTYTVTNDPTISPPNNYLTIRDNLVTEGEYIIRSENAIPMGRSYDDTQIANYGLWLYNDTDHTVKNLPLGLSSFRYRPDLANMSGVYTFLDLFSNTDEFVLYKIDPDTRRIAYNDANEEFYSAVGPVHISEQQLNDGVYMQEDYDLSFVFNRLGVRTAEPLFRPEALERTVNQEMALGVYLDEEMLLNEEDEEIENQNEASRTSPRIPTSNSNRIVVDETVNPPVISLYVRNPNGDLVGSYTIRSQEDIDPGSYTDSEIQGMNLWYLDEDNYVKRLPFGNELAYDENTNVIPGIYNYADLFDITEDHVIYWKLDPETRTTVTNMNRPFYGETGEDVVFANIEPGIYKGADTYNMNLWFVDEDGYAHRLPETDDSEQLGQYDIETGIYSREQLDSTERI